VGAELGLLLRHRGSRRQQKSLQVLYVSPRGSLALVHASLSPCTGSRVTPTVVEPNAPT